MPDQRHAAEVIEELGLAVEPADTPVCTTAREITEDEKAPLEGEAASPWTGPTSGSGHRWFAPSPRNLRHDPAQEDCLVPRRKVVLVSYFRWSTSGSRLHAYTDADWASCKESRLSGDMLVHNGTLLRFWLRKQKVVALSSLGERALRRGDGGH